MPIKAFWLLNANLDRCTAEQDLRAFSLALNSQAPEGAKEKIASLRTQMGMIYREKPKLDRKGLASLKDLAGKGAKK